LGLLPCGCQFQHLLHDWDAPFGKTRLGTKHDLRCEDAETFLSLSGSRSMEVAPCVNFRKYVIVRDGRVEVGIGSSASLAAGNKPRNREREVMYCRHCGQASRTRNRAGTHASRCRYRPGNESSKTPISSSTVVVPILGCGMFTAVRAAEYDLDSMDV
jgi:hypothetical protein